MTSSSSFEITIRRTYLYSSTIVGFARVVIDHQILLKEIPIFGGEDQIDTTMSIEPIAACPEDLDMDMLNKIVWGLRDVIEMAIIAKYKEQRNGTLN